MNLNIFQEVNFKIQRQQNVNMKTSIQNDHPWKLQQIQDAANHLQQAIAHIDNVDRHYSFKTSDEVMHVLGNILGCLQRSRTSLIVPRKKNLDDLINSRNMVINLFILIQGGYWTRNLGIYNLKLRVSFLNFYFRNL